MIHLDENPMGPLCKATSALVLASALALAGCGGGASSASSAPAAPSIMLFAANDGMTGIELWKSDGTATATLCISRPTRALSAANCGRPTAREPARCGWAQFPLFRD